MHELHFCTRVKKIHIKKTEKKLKDKLIKNKKKVTDRGLGVTVIVKIKLIKIKKKIPTEGKG